MTTPPPIRRFDKTSVPLLADLIFGMLQVVAEQYGITVSQEKGVYHEDSFTFSVTFRLPEAKGPTADFALKAVKVGLPADCWGKLFTFKGHAYTISDINPRSWRYPVLGRRVSDGARYKFAVRTIKDQLKS